jgi:Skp family chaperone for outer membrane proteins
MKKYGLTTLLILLASSLLYAQNVKIGFIEPQKVLEECKVGKNAMEQMNKILKGWELQFETMEKDYKKKIADFQSPLEEPPLTMTNERKDQFKKDQEAKKRKILEEIQNMEVEMMRFEQSINGTSEKGGTDGLLMVKQNEILKPILEKIEDVTKKYAIKNNYSLLLQDRPRNVAAYHDPELIIADLTSEIIKEMDKLPSK